MQYNLIVLPRAANDIVEAYGYYSAINIVLAERFLAEVKNVYLNLQSNPQFYSYIDSGKRNIFRDVKLKKFPYIAIFEIRKKDVILYAVKNTYTKPEKFKKI